MKNKKAEKKIYPAKAKQKLLKAKAEYQTVYIYGATGYGKTDLVKGLLNEVIDFFYDCTQEVDFSLIDNTPSKEKYCVVIDNLQCIRSIEKQKEVYQLMNRKDIWAILIGRANIPKWLQELYVNRKMVVIEEKDLWLSAGELEEIAGMMDIKLEPEKDCLSIRL